MREDPKITWKCVETNSDGTLFCEDPCELKVNQSDGTPCGCSFNLLDDAKWKQETE